MWFAVFGGAAINVQQNGTDLVGEGGSRGAAVHACSTSIPIATVASVVVMILVAIFFVSGADAASIVMGSLSQRGTIHPSRGTVVFWGVATGAVAAVMLLVGGADALTGLQTITIIAALPFLLVMVGMAVALLKDLRRDPKVVRREYAAEAVNSAVISGVTQHGDDFIISVEKDPNCDGRSGAVADFVRRHPARASRIRGWERRSVKKKKRKIPNDVYEAELFRLQTELVKLQEWVRETGARVVIIFEGRDAAGKGGTIKRITEYLSPRIARICRAARAVGPRAGPVVLPALHRAPARQG